MRSGDGNCQLHTVILKHSFASCRVPRLFRHTRRHEACHWPTGVAWARLSDLDCGHALSVGHGRRQAGETDKQNTTRQLALALTNMKPPEEATAWAPGSARGRAGTLPARGRGRDRKLTRKKSMAARALTSISQTVVASPKSSRKEVVLPPCTVWVGNVPFSKATEETLREVFEAYGEIKKLTVRQKPYKDGSNEHKSWAYVTFAGTDAMIRAVESSSWLQDEHDERVELIKQLPRTGPRSPGGAASTIIAAHTPVRRARAGSTMPTTALHTAATKGKTAEVERLLAQAAKGESFPDALARPRNCTCNCQPGCALAVLLPITMRTCDLPAPAGRARDPAARRGRRRAEH